MIPKNIRKLLYLYSRNCRMNLKDISGELKISPQAVSYHQKRFEAEKMIKLEVLTDDIILGYNNILVGFNLINYSLRARNTFEKKLAKQEFIVKAFNGKEEIDFIVEMKANNLSHFNKLLVKFLEENGEGIIVNFVRPIIVRHTYERNYLINKVETRDIITLGDRDVEKLPDFDLELIDLIKKDARIPLVNLATKLKVGVKRVIETKKKLERQRIIRKYSCSFDCTKLGITHKLIFLKIHINETKVMNKISEYCRKIPNIIEFSKLIGDYNVLVSVEALEEEDVLEGLRQNFLIVKHMSIEVNKKVV